MGNIYNYKLLVLALNFFLGLSFSSSFAFSEEVLLKQNKIFVFCAEAGGMQHNFFKTAEGYRLILDMGLYSVKPKYDPKTGTFEGPGYLGVDVPIENDNIRQTSMVWIKRKVDFFKTLFPETQLPFKGPLQTSRLILDFTEEACYLKKQDEFVYANCRADGPIDVNGVELENIDFRIQNQIRTTLLSDPDTPSELVVGDLETYYVDLIFAKKEGYGIIKYRSSTTYYPDGRDVQCRR